MDAKITKLRLSRMLSYDWLKIVGLAAAIIFFWVIVFTTTATRVIPSQQFIVCNYIGNVGVKSELNNSLTKSLSDKVLTHEVLEVSAVDLAVDRSMAYQLLQARVAVNEIDLVFVSQEGNTDTAEQVTASDGSVQTVYTQNYLENLLFNYRSSLISLDPDSENSYSLFTQLKNYLNGYYGDYQTGTLDTQKVETDFRARIQRNKDKRYKTEAQIKKGVEGEVDRLEKYRASLIAFYQYLDEGLVQPVNTSFTPSEDQLSMGVPAWEGVYAINICPDVKTMGGLSNVVAYSKEYTDENGIIRYENTAENMCVALFDSNGDEECYRYEGLVYLTNLIESVRTKA